ncbi:MAG: glycosyltransferase family 4 protein, partial [Verrucomicrobiales bacterium]
PSPPSSSPATSAPNSVNFAILTPGTGSYYCGACMRDNALAKSLHAAGHEVSLLPMYLPLQLDEAQLPTADNPIFFGGINVFLQQKLPNLRVPPFLHKLLNNTTLLRSAAKRSHMTSAREHGEMALAMLRLEESPFGHEMEKLIRWLTQEKPDVLILGTALQAGMIRTIQQRLDVKIICCFQGEDSFLDGLPQPFKNDCWNELTQRLTEADTLVSPSQFYADLMRHRLQLPDLPIEVIPNGITVPSLPSPRAPQAKTPPTIGYLARMIREKGVHHLVEAFIHLRHELKHPNARLHIAGAVTAGDDTLVAELKKQLTAANLTEAVTWSPNVSFEEKQSLLSGFTLFSVPATYPEAFGLYLIEALAAGTPVVQPDASSFREIVSQSNGGHLVVPNNPKALAEAWNSLLSQPDKLQQLGHDAHQAVRKHYGVDTMRDRYVSLANRLLQTPS